MNGTKIFGFLIIFTALIFVFTVSAQTAKVGSWKITVSESGGFAGIHNSGALDSAGNLTRATKNGESSEKIDEEKITAIGRLINELKLPGTKLKTVKGLRIYDGIYKSFVITLDGKDYHLEGTSFDDAKYLVLSEKQRKVFEKLKSKLDEIGGFPPDSRE